MALRRAICCSAGKSVGTSTWFQNRELASRVPATRQPLYSPVHTYGRRSREVAALTMLQSKAVAQA
jgi:hypothetical protein